MTNLHVGDCFLKLHNESLETDEILYNKSPLQVNLIQGELEVQHQHGQDSTQCVTHRIQNYGNPVMFNYYASRLSRSIDLPPHLFIRGKLSFYDEDAMYFCYEKYDMNFMRFMAGQYDRSEIRKVVRGFFEALCCLHKDEKVHGDLHYTNLVVRNGSGFLSGGIAPKGNNDLKDDLDSIAENIEKCYRHNFMALDEEITSLLEFILKKKTINFLLLHPFLLTPTLKKEFCINAVNFVQTMDENMYSSCGSTKLYIDLMNKCQITTQTYKGRTHHRDWVHKVNPNMKIYPHFTGNGYKPFSAYHFM